MVQQVDIGARVKPVLEVEGLEFRDLNANGVVDPYEDWRLSPAERAADLVARMSPEEKIGLMVINSRTMGISQPDNESDQSRRCAGRAAPSGEERSAQ